MADLRGHTLFSDMSQPATHRPVVVTQYLPCVVVSADMPGLQRRHMSLRLDGRHLVITGEGPLDPHEGVRRRFRIVVRLSPARENMVDKAKVVVENGLANIGIQLFPKLDCEIPDEEPVVVEYTAPQKCRAFTMPNGTFYVCLDIAGLKREQVRVSCNGNKLAVEAVDKRPGDPEPRRRFAIVMIVSGLAELEMTDEMKNGVLKLFLSKRK